MFNTFSKLLISFSTVLPNDFIAFVFKDMGFEIQSFPEANNGSGNYRSVMRVRRTLGNEDTL